MEEQLLGPYRIERGLLTFGAGTYVAANANPYFATELARAANDWSIDHWLDGRDGRLYGTVLLANQLPEEAARELRRIGGRPRLAARPPATNALRKPLGPPLFHPIYHAAPE